MRNYGIVKATQGKYADVAVPKGGECQRCGACILAASDHTPLIRAVNQVDARIGDRVEIEVNPKVAVTAAFLIFILPLLIAAILATIGYQIARRTGKDYLIAALLGALGFLGSFALLWFAGRRKATKTYAVVVGIVEQSQQKGEIPSGR